MFCEFSATQLRQLRGIYCNFTESDGSEDSGHCYFMPKLQKLLNVFREFADSQQYEGKEYSADYWYFIFMKLKFYILSVNKDRRSAKWNILTFLIWN